MADIEAAHPEDDVFGDVGSVIGHALEVARDEQGIEGRLDVLGCALHLPDHGEFHLTLHAVHIVVAEQDALGEVGIGVNEGFQRLADHAGGEGPHARDVGRHFADGRFQLVQHSLDDVHRLVANAFEVAVDLDDGEDEAQVGGHGLLHGEQVEREFVDFAFGYVDGMLGLEDVLAKFGVVLAVGGNGLLHGPFRQPTHAEQLVLEFVEAFLKTRAHYPNLPVM